MKYLKKIARIILKSELFELKNDLELYRDKSFEETSKKEKLEKKIKRLENPEHILLQYYRIDNISSNGLPPSYLNPIDKNDYTQSISELESIYRNKAFREMMAWALNFHANICASGKIKNDQGDEIDIKAEKAQDMINGIRAIWELVVSAHNKDTELTAKPIDPYGMLDEDEE